MIPKKIHYCWFGGNEKTELAKKCYESWKKFCPDYEIIEWNESNVDISKLPLYVQEAYENKKWAFVTDYVRLKVVYENGGIYFDTDVEVVKRIDDLLVNKSFFGIEKTKRVNTGLGFGAEKDCCILKDLMQIYNGISFIKEDGTLNEQPCPSLNDSVFVKYGFNHVDENQELKDGVKIYSSEYFCPKAGEIGKLKVTKNTYTIHWFSGSWLTKKKRKKQHMEKRLDDIRVFCKKIIISIFGEKVFNKIRRK